MGTSDDIVNRALAGLHVLHRLDSIKGGAWKVCGLAIEVIKAQQIEIEELKTSLKSAREYFDQRADADEAPGSIW